MRTTLEIDKKVLDEVGELTGETSQSKAVNEALREYIRRRRIEELISRAGKVDLELDDWYEFRHAEHA
jgi:Arc/MetJ family transcription regulator